MQKSLIQNIAAVNTAAELEKLCIEFRNKEFKLALKLRQQWDHQEAMELFEESQQLPCKKKCTTSYGIGDQNDDEEDWRYKTENTREAPYGCLSEDDMRRAIFDNDLDVIEENPILANIALGNLLKEDPDLEQELDARLRGDTINYDESLSWDEVTCIPQEAFELIEPQRSNAPRRAARIPKQEFLKIFA